MKLRVRFLIGLFLFSAALWIGWHSESVKSPETKVVPMDKKPVVKAVLPAPTLPSANSTIQPLSPKPIPAGVVKVPSAHPMAPPAVSEFRDWAEKYFLAEPEQRTKLMEEGVKLAEAHRKMIGQLIPVNPKLAIENAVPMVVRQDLPPEIVSKLEKRVNTHGTLVKMGVLGEGANPVAAMSNVFREHNAPEGVSSIAYLYGGRAKEKSLQDTRVNGIEVNGQLAVFDSRVRRLEVGERLDPAKKLIEICPVSGLTTQLATSASQQIPVTREDTAIVEDFSTATVVCVGGHILNYAEKLAIAEANGNTAAAENLKAEGGAGGASSPFNVPAGGATGSKPLLYIRAAFPDIMQEPRTEAEAYDVLRQTTDFFMESSFGRLYLTPTVAPLVVLPHPAQWYIDSTSGGQPNGYSLVFSHAVAEAAKMGYSTPAGGRTVVDYKGGAHNYQGTLFGGLGGGSSVWLYGQTAGSVVGVLSHELGHTFGLNHSNEWLPTTTPPQSIGPGHSVEYGNYFDVMGGATSMGHYVAVHKSYLNWLDQNTIHTVQADGTYRIYQVDQGTADAGKFYALNVAKDSERDYWVEFRQRHTTIPSLFNGVMLTWSPWGNSSQNAATNGSNGGAQLIDTTPGSAPLFNLSGSNADTRDDAGLTIGRTFGDTDANVYITPVVKSTSTPPYMDVVVNRGPFPGNHAPTLSIGAAPTMVFSKSSPINFTATATDLDGDPLAFSWNFNDGTYSTDNLSHQSHFFASVGDFFVTCTASDMKGGKVVKSVLVTAGLSSTEYNISGTVRDTLGNPIEGVLVANRAPTTNNNTIANADTYHSAFTDSDGKYVLTNLPGTANNVNTTITAYLTGYSLGAVGQNVFAGLSADQTGVDFVANASTNVITITVTDGVMSEGAADTAQITLTRPPTSPDVNLDIQVLDGSNGTATLGTVASGDYYVTANPTSAAITPVTANGSNVGTSRVRFAASTTGANPTPRVDSITLTLTARNDGLSEGIEYAVLEFPDTTSTMPIVGPRTITIPINDAQSSLPVVKIIADDPTTAEAGKSASMRLVRNGPTTNPLTVNLSYSGTVGVGTDVTAPASVIIPAGSSSVNFAITAIDDLLAEGIETGTVTIASSGTYQRDVNERSTDYYVTDNDQPVVSIVATDATAAETLSTATANPGKFTVSRVATDISQQLTVEFSLSGTALSGQDYRRIEGTVIIPAYETSADILIEPFDDDVSEPDQTVICRLGNRDGYAIAAPGSATVTITDNDKAEVSIQSLGVGNGSVQEPSGVPATTNLFAIDRASPNGSLSVLFTVSPLSTATSVADYDPFPTSVTFDPGVTRVMIPVTIKNDNTPEGTESIILKLNTSSSYRIRGSDTATALITDNATRATVDISFDDQSGNGGSIVTEPDGLRTITITNGGTGYTSNPTVTITGGDGTGATATARQTNGNVTSITITNAGAGYTIAPTVTITGGGGTGATAVAFLGKIIRFHFARLFNTSADTTIAFHPDASNTAVEGVDYATISPHSIVVPSGSNGAFLDVTLLNDNLIEGMETLKLVIDPGNYSIRTPEAIAYISDFEAFTGSPAPSVGFGVTTSRIPEVTGSAPSTVSIPVTLTGTPPSYPVTVSYDITGGSATGNGVDYSFTNGELTFTNGGPTTQLLTLTTKPDNVPEGDETVTITLSHLFGANFGSTTHTVTITDVSIPEAFTDPVIGLPTVTAEIAGHHHSNATAVVSSVVISNPGQNYTSAPTVSFSGATAGNTAKATAVVGTGGVTSIAVGAGGTGYASAPTVDITGGGGTGAVATATVTGGIVTGITITNIGTGYTSAPTIGFTGGGGSGATATAQINGIVGVNITDSGTGYTGTPAVNFSGGGGTGVAATAIIAPLAPLDGVGSVTIVSGGTGFTSAPTVTVSGGGGSGATARAVVSGGAITAITLVKPGSGYTTSPTINITGGGGTGAAASPVINNGAITSINVTAPGSGYNAGPVVAFTGGGGSGAVATATVSGGAVTGVTILDPGSGYTTPPTVSITGGNGAIASSVLSASLVWFEWGTNANSLNKTTDKRNGGLGSGQTNFSDIIDSLPALLSYPGTYFYRAVSQNGYGATKGIVRTTRTLGAAVPTTLKDTGHTASTITLAGTVNPNRQNLEAWFEWGTTTAYGFATAHQFLIGGTTVQSVADTVTGLTEGTLIHYRLATRSGSAIVYGGDMTAAAVPHQIAGDLLVNLNALQPTAGTASWSNQGGLLGGNFNSGSTTPALVANVLDTSIPGVSFNGATDYFVGPTASADVSGNDSRSIEVWVLNPGLGADDDIVSLGQDGARTESTLRYNNDLAGGALRHDGAANDAGYPAAAFPAIGKWHHLVYTYSGNKVAKLYIDGVLKITKATSANLNTAATSINLGARRNSGGTITGGTFSGFINSLRIHGGELTAAQVSANFGVGPTSSVAAAPLVSSKGASAITPNSATLNAAVTPNGLNTTAWFEWGTSVAYDNATPSQVIGLARSPTAITVPLASLADGIEYHFRVAAQNSAGTVYGEDKVFTTGSIQNAGIVWVDLRATDATAGTATWHNRGALGNFARVGTPALVANAASTGIPGVQFNGTTDVYESFALADADISFNSDRTVEVWVLNPGLQAFDEGPISFGRALGLHQQFVPLINEIKAWTDNTTQVAWPASPLVGAWHHLALVHLGTSVQLYLDGVLINTTALPSGSDTFNDSVVLGATRDALGALTWADHPFDGFINSVRVHGGALSASQLAANYVAGPYFTASGGVLPVATTITPPTLIGGASATLHATVLPGAIAATGWIQWGVTSGALNKTTPPVALSNGFATAFLSEPIGGLTSGTRYYYRAAAQNTNGTAYGTELFFDAASATSNLPTAVTNDASAVLIKTATLNGVATPGNLAANAWFEYGPTNALGSTTTKTAITAATASKTMTAPLTALKPHTTYSFRLVCENATGKVVGEIKTFTTGNTAPVATAGAVTIKEDAATTLSLKGTDADGETLSLVLVTPPTHGMLTGTTLSPLYTPTLNYNGTDSFTFGVSDGGLTPSNVVTFSITITAQPDGPIANNGMVSGNEDATSITGTATATDPEGDPITSFQVSGPTNNGTVTMNPNGNFTYVPNPNFFGTDSFGFTASNAGGTSLPATITITVNPQPDAPTASNSIFATDVDTDLDENAIGGDVDNQVITFIKVTDPSAAAGTVTMQSDGSFTFSPVTSYVGTVSFTFKTNDGTSDSATNGIITIIVGGPTADEATFTGIAGDAISDTLTGTDPGSLALTFSRVTNASKGNVTVNSDGSFIYNPSGNDVGDDSFTFKVNNGTLDSPPATVKLVMAPRPPNWLWVGGSSTAKKAGVYGTKGTPAATNQPGARGGFGAITDGTSNTILFGGNGIGTTTTSGLLNDLWMRDAISRQWTWLKGSNTTSAQGVYGAQSIPATNNTPGARRDFAFWRGGDGRFWIFGGSGRDSSATGNGLLNDLWVYDPVTNYWTWMKGSSFVNANGNYGTKAVSSSTVTPGARSGASAWTAPDGTLWLFGGNGRPASGTTNGNLNDLWKYDPVLNRWTWIAGPSTLDGNGTYGTLGVTNGASLPSARSFGTAWMDFDGRFYLFGGAGKGATGATKGNLNDLWSYDPLSNAWTWLTGSSAVNGAASYGLLGIPAATNTPGARVASAVFGDGSVRFVSGGQATAGLMNDVWRYDSAINQWTWVKGPSTPGGAASYGALNSSLPTNTPGARRGSVAISGIVDGTSNTLLFGENGANSYSDIWTLESHGEPLVSDLQVNGIGATGATIDGSVRFINDDAISAHLEWWLLSSPGSRTSTPDQIFDGSSNTVLFSETLSTLSAGRAYGVQLVADNSLGTTRSSPVYFSTTGVAAPVTAQFATVASTVSETAGWATASVTLSGPAPSDFSITVGYSGTATAGTDYTAGSTTLLIAQGQTSAVISMPVVNDGLDEVDETVILTLSAPTGGVTLGANAAHTVTITDDEISPSITTSPASVFAQTGASTTFTVAATGSSLTYQWKKNNVKITGATSASYTIASTKTTDAGNYTCDVINSLATLPSGTAELFVVDITPQSKVQATGNVTFTVTATGPAGTTITYAWSKDAGVISDVVGHRTGTGLKTLTFTGLLSTDTGTYTCAVSKTGTPGLNSVSGNFKLAVPNASPAVNQMQTLPVGVVNVPYSYQVLIDTDPLKTPTSFAATGLPAGLTINATTGIISGKTATAVNAKPITITATNGSGSNPLNTTITILALPIEAVGDSVALADRAAPNGNLGARFDVTTTALGTYTAKLTFQNTSIPASGSLSATLNMGGTAVTNVGATATFLRTGKPSITVPFSLDLGTHALTGTVTDPLVGPVVNINGWHRKWSTTAPQATAYAGYYTTAFDIPQQFIGDADVPQGSSYSSFTIGTDGKLTLAGRTADGQTFSVATITGPSGQLPFFAAFTKSPGSLIGELAINSGNSDVTGILAWTKGAAPTTSTDMAYRAGFGPISLNTVGGMLPVIPVTAALPATGVFMNLPDSDLNTRVGFQEGGLELTDVAPVVFSIRDVNATNNAQKVTVPANSAKLTFVLGTTPVGSYTGTFTIPNATAALVRKVTFQGAIVHNSAGYRNAGYFLLSQLPQPGQTLTTSKVLSGNVLLGPSGP